MPLRLAVLVFAAALLSSPPLLRADPAAEGDGGLSEAIGAEEIRAHVKHLASDELSGRRAGTDGARRAAAWIAERFAAVGLEPGGDDGTYFQKFALPSMRLVAEKSGLSVAGSEGEPEPFAPGEDFAIFGNAADGALEDKSVVFARHGIRAEALGVDDYAGLDVAGKIALVLRHGPGERASDYRFSGRNMVHVTFDRKAELAEAAGAAALLVVNDRFHHPGRKDDLEAAMLGRTRSIPVLFAKAEVAEALFAAAGRDFAEAERAADGDAAGFELPGARLSLTVTAAREITENVVGILPGADPARKGEAVVIGAHYDHLGTDGRGSLDPFATGEIRNGADDNASGTAGVVELAEHFALSETRPARSLVFVAFTAEELGLVGSRYYVENPTVPLDRTVAMLNMDMIGRGTGGKLFVGGTGTSPVFDGILDAALDGLSLAVRRGEGGVAPSDNTSFFEKGVPALFFFTGIHGDYHRATDDWEKVDCEAEATILEFVARIATAVGNLEERPAYVENRGPGFPGGGAGGRPRLGVTLGRPVTEKGVTVEAVLEDSPAAKAGLRPGDVITAIGPTATPDPAALRAALAALKPGTETEIHLLRATTPLTLPLTLP